MVSCPQCNDPSLSTSRLRLGTPAFPVKCESCGVEFHGNYFWLGFLLSIVLTVGAVVGAMVASTLWRSSTAILLPFAIAASIMLFVLLPLSKFQVPVPTGPRVKQFFRICVWLLVLYALWQVAHDVLAA